MIQIRAQDNPVNVKPSYDGHYRDLLTLLLSHLACAELGRSRIHVIFLVSARSSRRVPVGGDRGERSCDLIQWLAFGVDAEEGTDPEIRYVPEIIFRRPRVSNS